jgi:hypothetical protein
MNDQVKEKTMRKRIILTGVLSIMLVAGAVCLQVGECRANDMLNCWSETYFEHHPMMVQQLTKEYGQPGKIVNLDGGKQDYVYQKQGKDPMLESTRHFIVKDGKVLSSFLKD